MVRVCRYFTTVPGDQAAGGVVRDEERLGRMGERLARPPAQSYRHHHEPTGLHPAVCHLTGARSVQGESVFLALLRPASSEGVDQQILNNAIKEKRVMAIQDILVFRPADGAFAKWYSDGSVGPAFNFQEVGYIGRFPGAWHNAQMIPADFNGDGNVDILVFRPADGAFAKWYSDGSVGPAFNFQEVGYIGGSPGAWHNAQMIPADFNGDGNVDILVFRPADGAFAKWYSDGSVGPAFNFQEVGYIGGSPGAWHNAQMIPADFNGDGNVDILVFRPADGAFAKWYSDGSVGPASTSRRSATSADPPEPGTTPR